MPYITKEQRNEFFHYEMTLESLADVAKESGQLNYLLTAIIVEHLRVKTIENGNKMNYEMLNNVIGVLECCKQELYRRVIAPYEEIKKSQNGDVYFKDHHNFTLLPEPNGDAS